MNTTSISKFTPWLVILIAGILYIFTLDTGLRPEELTGGDLITHQYAQVQARPGNAPGYPLYTMLGWLSFRVGRAVLGWLLNPIQVLSLYSAIWGLASLWVLYHILHRPEVTGRNWLLSALLTLFYAVTYFFWYYSVTTEQYTSAIFQTLLLVWLAFEWESLPANFLPGAAQIKRQNSTQGRRDARTQGEINKKSLRLCVFASLRFFPSEFCGTAILLLMAFVSGAMLANMLTTLFILPPLLYLIFTRKPGILKDFKLLLLTVAAGLLPVLSYAYVYIRGAQHPEWRGTGGWSSTAEWFWQFISAQQGRDELAPGLTLSNLFTPEYPSLVWGELTWIVLIGGLIGWLLLGKRKAIFFYGTLVIYLIFSAAYRFGNWFQVILPLYPLLALGFGRSVGWVWEWLAGGESISPPLNPPRWGGSFVLPPAGGVTRSGFFTRGGRDATRTSYHRSWRHFAKTPRVRGGRDATRTSYLLRAALILALITLIAYRFTASLADLARVGRHNLPTDTGLDPGWAVLADVAEPGWIISTDFEEWVALQYLSEIWGAEPKISLQNPDQPAEYITRRAAPAFPELLDLNRVIPQSVGATLIHLANEPLTELPPTAAPANVDFGGQMRLLGYDTCCVLRAACQKNTQHATRNTYPDEDCSNAIVTLYWTAAAPMDEDYTISVRLWQNGQPLQGDDGPLIQDHQPVWNLYPTDKWQANTLIADAYTFDLPPNAASDQMQVIVYRATSGGFENLGEAILEIYR